MSSVHGKVAVVTGAGSGIGRELAFELARRGARLAVSAAHEGKVDETADRVKALGADVHAAAFDVSDRAAVVAHAADVVGRFGVVHQVYNNAGIAGSGRTVLDTEWVAYERAIGIDLFGVIHGTKAFLPHLIASGDGHVINVSSLNGLMAQPALSDYCAAKFGVRGFTEALRAEMLAAGHPVRVTIVHPGGVRTGIATASLEHSDERGGAVTAQEQERARIYNEKLLRMSAEEAARIIVDGVEADKARIVVGADARFADLLVRLAPGLYPLFAVWLERRLFGTADAARPLKARQA